MSKTLVCSIVAANGEVVVDETIDYDGDVYADYKLIVDKVNKETS